MHYEVLEASESGREDLLCHGLNSMIKLSLTVTIVKAGASGTAGTVLAVSLFWRKLYGGESLTGVAYGTPPYLRSAVPCRDYSQLLALQLCSA